MSRLHALHGLKTEVPIRPAVMGCLDVDHETPVVTGVPLLDDRSGEPRGGVREDWRATGSRVPRAVGELVDLVTGLRAEQRRQTELISAEQVGTQMRRRKGDAIRVVLVRQADQVARRVDAALGGEPDQTTAVLTAGRSRDNQHRVVDAVGDRLEGGGSRHDRIVTRVGSVASIG